MLGGPWNHTHPEHPLKMVSGRNPVENAAIQPLPTSRPLALSNRSGAGRGSASGARARGFCPLLWSRGPRPTTGLRSHTPPVGLGRLCGQKRQFCKLSSAKIRDYCLSFFVTLRKGVGIEVVTLEVIWQFDNRKREAVSVGQRI